jgi:ribosomal protein S30
MSVVRHGSLMRSGKTKRQTPFEESKDEKKKTGRAKKRFAQPTTDHSAKAALEIERQQYSRELKEQRAEVRHSRQHRYPEDRNTKKPKNIDYKHETNAHREEVQIVNEQLQEDGWTIIRGGKKFKE